MRTLTTLLLFSALTTIGCAKDGSGSDSGGGSGGGDGTNCSEDGAMVFIACAGCHGSDGQSGSSPDLSEAIPTLSDDDLMNILMNGIGSMPPPNLTTCEEDALFTYLRDTHGEEGGG